MPSIQILVSLYHISSKDKIFQKAELLGKMTNSRTGAGKIILLWNRLCQKSKIFPTNEGELSKGHRTHLKGVLAKIWDNLVIKINNDNSSNQIS
jgi:hypothetical protein